MNGLVSIVFNVIKTNYKKTENITDQVKIEQNKRNILNIYLRQVVNSRLV